MPNRNRKGVLLFIVLGTIIVVATLATVILRIILSQSRLTHHQISRIQAQYVAKAGMVYALEMLRTNAWTYSPTNSCPDGTPCVVTDTSFPPSVVNKQFSIVFCPSGSTCAPVADPCTPPVGYSYCINSTAVFTYSP